MKNVVSIGLLLNKEYWLQENIPTEILHSIGGMEMRVTAVDLFVVVENLLTDLTYANGADSL